MRGARRALVAAVAVALVLASVPGGFVSTADAAAVIQVDDDGPSDYDSVARAVDAASSGDRIEVAPGTYDDTVRVDKELTIVGDTGDDGPGPGGDAPVLVAQGGPAMVIGDAPDVEVRGFVFAGTGTGLEYDPRAISVEGLEVTQNRFEGTTARVRFAERGLTARDIQVRNNEFVEGNVVVAATGGRITARGVTVADNVLRGGDGTAVSVASTSVLNDVELEVFRNRVLDGGGDGIAVRLADARNATVRVEGNVVAGNAGSGVVLEDRPGTGQVYVRGNNISNNGVGVELRASASPERYTVAMNTIAGNDQGVVNTAGPYLDARDNYWGARLPSGATPQELADPFVGLILDGEGDTVPEGPIDGTASVLVAPSRDAAPPVRVLPGFDPGSGGAQFRYVEGDIDRRAAETGDRIIARVTYVNTGGELAEFTAFINLNRGERRIGRETKRVPPGQEVTYQIPVEFSTPNQYRVYERANFLGRLGVIERSPTVVEVASTTEETVRVNVSNARADQPVAVSIPGESGNVTFDSVTLTVERDIDVGVLVEPSVEPPARLPRGVTGLRVVRLTSGTFDDDLQRVAFRFTATKAELLEAGASQGYENVTLYRLDPATDAWEPAGDLRVEENRPGNVTFLAETGGFSTYALGVGEPTFTVTNASLGTSETRVGSPVGVNATVRNYEGSGGTFAADLVVGNDTVATRNVSLSAGEAGTVGFRYAPEAAGTYNVSVEDRRAGTLQVATTTTTTTTTTTATTTTVNTTTATTATSATTTGGQPGFTALLVLMAVVAAALLAARRR